ncbi:YcxB family protein [Blastopirellula marina]|uniref:YcxB-like C-terminal domain-containing protein n=1 Tax=Blastopirellula marina DSM 3645 TaxID=314230 RepID=A3ZSP7_9BACT|nr:YcxB family protein [Blastopirellula marina]EAQ80319.1 hypothetical protein DSM3645_10757 [Blastopirellula marina DSM 3645]
MEVEFQYCDEDADAFGPEEAPQHRWRNNVLLIVGGVLIGVPGVIPALLLDFRWVAGMIAIAYYSALYRYARYLFQLPAAAIFPSGGFRVRLTPNFLEEAGDNHRARFSWSHIEEVIENREAVLIYPDPHRAIVIPKRAFASSSEMRQFAALAQQYRKEALETTSPAIGLYDDDFFSAWTRDAGLSVEYQNTRADWAHAMQFGAYESPWQSMGTRVSKYVIFLILSVVMLYMAWTINHIGFKAFCLVASAAFWYVGSISLALVVSERGRRQDVPEQWLARRTLFISPIGAIALTPFAIHCTKWIGLEAVLQNTSFLYFLESSVHICQIAPKRAFPTFGQAEHFAHEAIQWRQAAFAVAEEEAANDAAHAVDGENPFRSPQA